ncbi:Coatomer subunit delta [Raphanus sativus]|nr:Coatomer subunit delta [Raphanus sativus]
MLKCFISSGAVLVWTKVSGNKTRVSITYDTSCFFNLTNVIISISLPPALRDVMTLQRVKELGAAMEVTSDNQHGLLEFMVPPVDSSEVFFPISSQFATSNTFNGVKVTRVFSETGSGDGGFVQTTHPITQNCQVV